MKTIYFFVLIVVVASLPIAKSGVHGSKQNYQLESQSHGSNIQNKYYKRNQESAETTASRKLDSPPAHKLNVTAWGIIGIILGVIIFSTITYYVFILYPYICKKERSYDIIELTDVNSVCAVNDIPLYRSNNVSNNVSANH